jgi:macrodomain Ter protein organizer (MatP/YcbG family)
MVNVESLTVDKMSDRAYVETWIEPLQEHFSTEKQQSISYTIRTRRHRASYILTGSHKNGA